MLLLAHCLASRFILSRAISVSRTLLYITVSTLHCYGNLLKDSFPATAADSGLRVTYMAHCFMFTPVQRNKDPRFLPHCCACTYIRLTQHPFSWNPLIEGYFGCVFFYFRRSNSWKVDSTPPPALASLRVT